MSVEKNTSTVQLPLWAAWAARLGVIMLQDPVERWTSDFISRRRAYEALKARSLGGGRSLGNPTATFRLSGADVHVSTYF